MVYDGHGWYDKFGKKVMSRDQHQYWYISNKEHYDSVFISKNNRVLLVEEAGKK